MFYEETGKKIQILYFSVPHHYRDALLHGVWRARVIASEKIAKGFNADTSFV